ncbi:MAG: sigma-70 family RNA polymerase sigma factor [Planctomycetales bacterium]|nr:sigma-70 family RNA polymerase sigma factor [Planctomycetales bacterium]
MAEFPDTRISLIIRLGEASDVQAWQEFAEIYAPALLGLARRRGLQPADAEDVTQEILFGVARAVQRFQPDQNRAMFRTWLSRIAHNLIHDFCEGRRRRPAAHAISDSWLEKATQAGESASHDDFDEELRASILRLAAKRVQERVAPKTWNAFEQTAIQNRTAEWVSQEFGMTVGSVYVARCRVMSMLRNDVQQLLADCQVTPADSNAEEGLQ